LVFDGGAGFARASATAAPGDLPASAPAQQDADAQKPPASKPASAAGASLLPREQRHDPPDLQLAQRREDEGAGTGANRGASGRAGNSVTR